MSRGQHSMSRRASLGATAVCLSDIMSRPPKRQHGRTGGRYPSQTGVMLQPLPSHQYGAICCYLITSMDTGRTGSVPNCQYMQAWQGIRAKAAAKNSIDEIPDSPIVHVDHHSRHQEHAWWRVDPLQLLVCSRRARGWPRMSARSWIC